MTISPSTASNRRKLKRHWKIGVGFLYRLIDSLATQALAAEADQERLRVSGS